jgi:mxaJ protein
MYSAFRIAFAFAFVVTTSVVTTSESSVLRVCADPNNLPFSNRLQQGFENKIALIIASEMK